jgi:hypothetical protein
MVNGGGNTAHLVVVGIDHNLWKKTSAKLLEAATGAFATTPKTVGDSRDARVMVLRAYHLVRAFSRFGSMWRDCRIDQAHRAIL